VEKGTPPDRLLATKFVDDAAATPIVARTRPLCPYPQRAVYGGAGDRALAASYTCTVGSASTPMR
jgi:feruloyl esterase